MSKLVRHTDFYPAFDKRAKDPEKNYGIHCVTLRFAVSGPLGAVHFTLYTGWHLPEIQKEMELKANRTFSVESARILNKPIPVDIGHHSPVPKSGAEEGAECDLLPGGWCYGSGGNMMRAKSFYDTLTQEGSEGIWKRLEGEYRATFTGPAAKKAMGVSDEVDGSEEVSEEKVQDEG
jgi:hypothetical protein